MAKSKSPNIISIEDVHEIPYKLLPVIKILEQGGVGVIPTDSCYSFVTSINSREGTKRLMDLKGFHGQKKPLSLLCKDYSAISKYTSNLTDQKWVYKLLRDLLPGPYTIIIPASNEVPKIIIEKHKHIKRWRRREIGIRMPDDSICTSILQFLDSPLLCGSVPEAAEDVIGIIHDLSSYLEEESNEEIIEDMKYIYLEEQNFLDDIHKCDWINQVDFIIDNGKRGGVESNSLTTVIDLTSGEPIVLREGIGKFDVKVPIS